MQFPAQWQSADGLFNEIFGDSGRLQTHSVAQKYAGHQFGQWNPDLGDGRGLLLGEWVTDGHQRWDLHLKGAGKTPYSRFGDGRAVLRSTIREYLASEALHYLGIPSSRALALISSYEPVYREKTERGAMLIRVCQSHIRFGHFEHLYHSKQFERLKELFDYCFELHFPHCLGQPNPQLALLTEITQSTARLIAKWQAYGFNHGVMNTDNMSIHGITFDYGPYAFLDDFEPDYICNHSDHQGRYAFDQQPGIGLWNLNALAQAFTPYLHAEQIKQALDCYEPTLLATYSALMHKRLGFVEQNAQSQALINRWLNLLAQDKRDYHIGFRKLCSLTPEAPAEQLVDDFIHRESAQVWLTDYRKSVFTDNTDIGHWQAQMRANNPKIILRNYLLQQAIELAENNDFSLCERLLSAIAQPFEDNPEFDDLAKPPPDWGKRMEISCSS